MPTFNVKWSVHETVVGSGDHDGGVREGDRFLVAQGDVDKEAESPEQIDQDLRALLMDSWPLQGLGPTYNLDRQYDIAITPKVLSGASDGDDGV